MRAHGRARTVLDWVMFYIASIHISQDQQDGKLILPQLNRLHEGGGGGAVTLLYCPPGVLRKSKIPSFLAGWRVRGPAASRPLRGRLTPAAPPNLLAARPSRGDAGLVKRASAPHGGGRVAEESACRPAGPGILRAEVAARRLL